jgi:hypothetical protein
MFERNARHRGESRDVIRISHIFLGASALINVILIAGLSDSVSDTLEIKQATHDITNYLQDDGYDGVRNLTIDYIEDTFSFTISDNINLLGCKGSYKYDNDKIKDVGHVACEKIDFPVIPSEPPRFT